MTAPLCRTLKTNLEDAAETDIEITYTIDPGDPGCWRTPNGDGWPAIPAHAEIQSIKATDGREIDFELLHSKEQRRLEERCLEDASEADEAARYDAADTKRKEMRERRD